MMSIDPSMTAPGGDWPAADCGVEAPRLGELVGQWGRVAGLGENFEAFGGSFTVVEQVEASVVEASPYRGEEEAVIWLQVLNLELNCAWSGSILCSGK